MRQELTDCLDLLDLEPIENNLFLGVSPPAGWERVYGGQVLAQALTAAARTVDDDRPPHSLHGYFLRAGDPSIPILYSVDRIRDGRSFTTRRVVAIQRGAAIFSMAVSFQIDEPGLEHSVPMPDVPGPEDVPPQPAHADQPVEFEERSQPIEMRFVEPYDEYDPKPAPPWQHVWVRTVDAMPVHDLLHRCMLAYASDMTLLDTSYRTHGLGWRDQDFHVASLDHAMWFHRSCRTDEWLLYAQDSPNSGGARGFARGAFFTQSGELVASVAQEGLIRLHRTSADATKTTDKPR